MKFRNLPLFLLIAALLCACEAPQPISLPLTDLPGSALTQAPAAAQENPTAANPAAAQENPTPEANPVVEVNYTAVPAPGAYCDGAASTAATAVPPQPFLYQPFVGELSAKAWSSQMDHDRPDYTQNGVLAALGETMRFNPSQTELQGGTQSYGPNGQKWFSRHVNPFSILQLGYGLLA